MREVISERIISKRQWALWQLDKEKILPILVVDVGTRARQERVVR
jgi:hypothetical protein